MKNRFAFRLFILLLLAAFIVSCGGSADDAVEEAADAIVDETEAVADETEEEVAEEIIPIDFRLNWTLYGEHAPFFLGVDKGFYEEEGLDVTILEGSGSSTVVKLLGRGENVIGYADSATMMRGVTQGVPVHAVAVMLQTSPMSFIYREDAARPTTIDELPGTSVAITAGDASLAIFESCLGRNDMTMDDVSMVVVSNPAAKETAVLEGQANTFLGYYIDQPLRMEQQTGVDMGWSKLVDICDVNTLSSAIIVNNRWAEDNPEIVEKFVRASQRAWEYSSEHPEEAAEIFAQHAEAFDAPLAQEEVEGAISLLHTDNSAGQPIGWSSPDDWQATQDLLAEFAGLNAEEDVSVYFSNDFISAPPYLPGE